MKISPARIAAFEILEKIETKRAFSSDLLPAYEQTLSTRDRGLCHEITLGVLRRQLYLDRLTDYFADNRKLDLSVRIALRIGLYQLLFLDRVPAHAVINDSVELVARAKKSSAKGLVNAILRRATRENAMFEYTDETERLSVETSHPRWLIERWARQFGSEAAGVANANNTPAPLAFRLIGDDLPLFEGRVRRSEFVEGCFIVDAMDEQLLKLAADNSIYFQDEASQMVAASIVLADGQRFLDVCASPGGKTTMIARRAMDNKTLVAGDLHWPRVNFLQNNCVDHRVPFVNVVRYNAEVSLPFADDGFDLVLVDAPCSGTGTIRRNPEIRYFLTPADLDELQRKQLRILKNASKSVKPGAMLIYSTCSLEREENEEVCRGFLEGAMDFEHITSGFPERFETNEGYARTLPHRDDMDGFFVARFYRRCDLEQAK